VPQAGRRNGKEKRSCTTTIRRSQSGGWHPRKQEAKKNQVEMFVTGKKLPGKEGGKKEKNAAPGIDSSTGTSLKN